MQWIKNEIAIARQSIGRAVARIESLLSDHAPSFGRCCLAAERRKCCR